MTGTRTLFERLCDTVSACPSSPKTHRAPCAAKFLTGAVTRSADSTRWPHVFCGAGAGRQALRPQKKKTALFRPRQPRPPHRCVDPSSQKSGISRVTSCLRPAGLETPTTQKPGGDDDDTPRWEGPQRRLTGACFYFENTKNCRFPVNCICTRATGRRLSYHETCAHDAAAACIRMPR